MNKKSTETVLADVRVAKETFWINPDVLPYSEAEAGLKFHKADIEDARARLERFAPLIMKHFPETEEAKGIIESPLKETPELKKIYGFPEGRLFLKCDSHLPIAGSVKARGGIYEVLKHTEELALKAGLLTENSTAEEYAALADHRDFFSQYKVQVGSTGNLGMSIGIMSAAIGYQAFVHMSADAKEWKKKLLRSKGVTVIEYADDYSKAVQEGRAQSDADPMSYFVDDESSSALYLGYAVVGERLKKQLAEQNVTVDEAHKLIVYIPCGVGGAPGGITFGLKEAFGDNVIVYFVEPTQAPCMLVGLASGEMDKVSVKDFGLTGQTDADGLAVGRCSRLVAREMTHLLAGESTVDDSKLYKNMQQLYKAEGIIIEPSSCATYQGLIDWNTYCKDDYSAEERANMTHVIWATGGRLMPKEIIEDYLSR